MNINDELKNIICIAKEDLKNNDNGELLRPFRKSIEKLLSKKDNNKKKRKVILALNCVDKSLEKKREFIVIWYPCQGQLKKRVSGC